MSQEIEDIKSALQHINADDRDTWLRVGMAMKSGLGEYGFDLWDNWSSTSKSYNEKDARTVWQSFKSGGIGIGTLFHEAKQNGWQSDSKPQLRVMVNPGPEHQPDLTNDTKQRAIRAWELSTPAPPNHPYLLKKNIKPNGVGVLGCIYFDAPKFVRNDGNLLIIPIMDLNLNVWSIQFISESGKKAYLRGQRKKGSFYWIDGNTEVVYLCEGFATGATLHQETGHAVACAFDAHSLIHVAKALARRFTKDQIVIMADDDWRTPSNPGIKSAQKAAREIGSQVRIPDFTGLPRGDKDSDFNDYQRLRNTCHG